MSNQGSLGLGISVYPDELEMPTHLDTRFSGSHSQGQHIPQQLQCISPSQVAQVLHMTHQMSSANINPQTSAQTQTQTPISAQMMSQMQQSQMRQASLSRTQLSQMSMPQSQIQSQVQHSQVQHSTVQVSPQYVSSQNNFTPMPQMYLNPQQTVQTIHPQSIQQIQGHQQIQGLQGQQLAQPQQAIQAGHQTPQSGIIPQLPSQMQDSNPNIRLSVDQIQMARQIQAQQAWLLQAQMLNAAPPMVQNIQAKGNFAAATNDRAVQSLQFQQHPSASPTTASFDSSSHVTPEISGQVSPAYVSPQNFSPSNTSPSTLMNPTTPSSKFNIPTPRTESNYMNPKFQQSAISFKEFDTDYSIHEMSMGSLTPVDVLFEENEKLKLEDILKDDPLFELYEEPTTLDTATSDSSSSKRKSPKLKKQQSLSNMSSSNIKKKRPPKPTKSFSLQDCSSTFQSFNTINIIQENFTKKNLTKSRSMGNLKNDRKNGFGSFHVNT